MTKFNKNKTPIEFEGKIENPKPWIEIDKKIKSMVADYISGFCTSRLWEEAEAEGWELSLYRYAHSVATVQAQMIHGAKVGWCKDSIMGINAKVSDDDLWRWLQRQREQASTGFISVSVPTTRINEWKKFPKISMINELQGFTTLKNVRLG